MDDGCGVCPSFKVGLAVFTENLYSLFFRRGIYITG